MKKVIISAFLSFMFFPLLSQYYYQFGPNTEYQLLGIFSNTIMLEAHDTIKYRILVDSLQLKGLRQTRQRSPINFGLNSVVMADTNGWIYAVDKDSLPYLKNVTSGMVTSALGYTPYNGSTNPNGYISSYTETDPLFNTKFSGKTTADLTENTNLYFTTARARNSISVTNIGTSGSATYDSSTGVFNIPNYTSSSGTVTSVGLASTDLTVSGSPITSSGNITLDLSNTGVSPGTYDWVTVDAKGRATAGANSPVPSSIASGARNFNQAYQLSSTRPAFISISPSISCALSLSGGQAGNIQLQISPNGSSGWISVATMLASNTGTLTIGLNTVQISGAQLDVSLPAGYYWRAVTTNTTGTPTYTFNGGYELIY